MNRWIAASCFAISLLAMRQEVNAQAFPNLFKVPTIAVPTITVPSLTVPTLGGKQFWSDQYFFHSWRIQKNAVSGHSRLLDGNDQLLTIGSYETCHAKLEKVKLQQRVPPMRGKAVIMLHGLGRTRTSLNKLGNHLREQGGYTIFNVSYASTREAVATHAANLDQIVANLHGITEINFVGHSMGNIVVRHWMADQLRKQGKIDPRVGRVVMLAPPNNGSKMARFFGRTHTFKFIVGDAGQELGNTFENLDKKLATPPVDFGIIAGTVGLNPWLKGEDDLIVSVAETKLVGARDFRVISKTHTYIMNHEKTLQYTLQFFRNGYFQSETLRQPIVEQVAERITP